MSIIHDALKKTQQSLASKTDEMPVENFTPAKEQIIPRKSPAPAIKNIFIIICAIVITAGSVWYICQRLNKKSFYKLIHRQEFSTFKIKSPQELKPLAQLTINQASLSPTATPAAPLTLNIHGIMANATGNVVLINDQVYQEGDSVDGAKIVKINLDSITVNNNGIEQTILVKS